MSRASSAKQLVPAQNVNSGNTSMQNAKNTLNQIVKLYRQSRARSQNLAKNQELQALIDKEIFIIEGDRQSHMTGLQQLQILQTLAQFFLDKAEDSNRFNYFETIFLARESDPGIHKHRMDLLKLFISLSLQYPVFQVFNLVNNWLGKITNSKTARMYCDMIISTLTTHFIQQSNMENNLFEFLLPLQFESVEFTAIFIALAPLSCDINVSLCITIFVFLHKNLQFILRHFRDTPYLGEDFATKTIPKLVEHVITDEKDPDIAEMLTKDLVYIIFSWNNKVITQGRAASTKTPIEITDLLLDPKHPWNQRRCDLLNCMAFNSKTYTHLQVFDKLQNLDIPPAYNHVLDYIQTPKNEAPNK